MDVTMLYFFNQMKIDKKKIVFFHFLEIREVAGSLTMDVNMYFFNRMKIDEKTKIVFFHLRFCSRLVGIRIRQFIYSFV